MIINETEEETTLEPPQQLIDQQHKVSINTIDFEELNGIISTDQTGGFPITSGQGNTCMMVMYDNDTNLINTIIMKYLIYTLWKGAANDFPTNRVAAWPSCDHGTKES